MKVLTGLEDVLVPVTPVLRVVGEVVGAFGFGAGFVHTARVHRDVVVLTTGFGAGLVQTPSVQREVVVLTIGFGAGFVHTPSVHRLVVVGVRVSIVVVGPQPPYFIQVAWSVITEVVVLDIGGNTDVHGD